MGVHKSTSLMSSSLPLQQCPPHMAVQKQDDQHEHTFSSYVRIPDVVLRTRLGRWTIGRSGERGSGISVLPARDDDDDDDDDDLNIPRVQSTGTVEYTDCIFTEG